MSDHNTHIYSIAQLEDFIIQVQDVAVFTSDEVQDPLITPVTLSAPRFIDQLIVYFNQMITNQKNCEFCQR